MISLLTLTRDARITTSAMDFMIASRLQSDRLGFRYVRTNREAKDACSYDGLEHS